MNGLIRFRMFREPISCLFLVCELEIKFESVEVRILGVILNILNINALVKCGFIKIIILILFKGFVITNTSDV